MALLCPGGQSGCRKPELFFALVTVDSDTGQLMDREVPELKLGLTCREQKVPATHEFLVKEKQDMLCLVDVEIYCEPYISLNF